ncbi:MAG: ribonuclease [Devosia sp.]
MDRRFRLVVSIVALLAAAAWLWFSPPEQQPPQRTTPPIAERPAASSAASPTQDEALPPATTSARPGLYILAMSWFPGFCSLKQRAPECRDAGPTFALHGLWPADEYCGVSDALRQRDLDSGWQTLPAVTLSAATRAALDAVMPGTRSSLERHEWLAHGTCSGVSADRYFARAASFAAAVRNSALTAFFASSRGKTVSRADVQSAADAAFGKGLGTRLRLSCTSDGHRQVIDEVTIALYGNVVGGTDGLTALMRATRPKNGGCDNGLVR